MGAFGEYCVSKQNLPIQLRGRVMLFVYRLILRGSPVPR
jgi:hypothetical protein